MFYVGERVIYPMGIRGDPRDVEAIVCFIGYRSDNGERYYTIEPLREDGSRMRTRNVAEVSIRKRQIVDGDQH